MTNNINLTSSQSDIFDALFLDKLCRFGTAVCARGFGKSYLGAVTASTATVELMQMSAKVPNKNVFIIAPTYDQVTDIYYPLLAHELGLINYAIKGSKDKGVFTFPNNVMLRLMSYEAVERMRGKGAYFVVNDEVSSWNKGMGFKKAWEDIIEPCINTRWSPERAAFHGAPSAGRALTISTPKGYNYLYDMFNMREHDKTWRSWRFDYRASPYIDPNEIERIKENRDPITFASEYMAAFKESGASVFYMFDRTKHVRDDIPNFTKTETVRCNIDFNVGIQATSFWAKRGGQAQFISEFQGHPDTEELAKAIRYKYGPDRRIIAYPDPTGNSRKTSAPVGQTDFTILKKYNIQVLTRGKSPGIVDSVACVNRMLGTATGKTNLFVRPECKGTIKSLERTIWVNNNSDSATIDKKEGVEHFSDGIRYGMEYEFPINNRPGVAQSPNF